MLIHEAFGLQSGQLLALVGGGGKSSLLFAIGRTYPGRVLMTTTTRIFAEQAKQAVMLSLSQLEAGHESDPDPIGRQLQEHGHCLIIGRLDGQKAAGVSPDLPQKWLSRRDVDLVVVEADGSRMQPIKAPAAHEPVIPTGTTLLIPVAGIDALGRPIGEIAHRPELVSDLTGLPLDARLTPAAVATVLTHPAGGLKGLPAGARCIPCINKVETDAQLLEASRSPAISWNRPG